jgi:hypothetical protein
VVRWRHVNPKDKIEILFGVEMHERTLGRRLEQGVRLAGGVAVEVAVIL